MMHLMKEHSSVPNNIEFVMLKVEKTSGCALREIQPPLLTPPQSQGDINTGNGTTAHTRTAISKTPKKQHLKMKHCIVITPTCLIREVASSPFQIPFKWGKVCKGWTKRPSGKEGNAREQSLLGDFCDTMIGRAEIEESKSNVAMNAWLTLKIENVKASLSTESKKYAEMPKNVLNRRIEDEFEKVF